jgi:hypothetical protein
MSQRLALLSSYFVIPLYTYTSSYFHFHFHSPFLPLPFSYLASTFFLTFEMVVEITYISQPPTYSARSQQSVQAAYATTPVRETGTYFSFSKSLKLGSLRGDIIISESIFGGQGRERLCDRDVHDLGSWCSEVLAPM